MQVKKESALTADEDISVSASGKSVTSVTSATNWTAASGGNGSFWNELVSGMDDDSDLHKEPAVNSVGRNGGKRKYVDPKIAEREGRIQTLAKIAVAFVLVVAVAIVATVLYWMITTNERHDFEVQFENYASEVITVAQQNAKATFQSVESMALAISSLAVATNQEWPKVTIPQYALRCKGLAEATNAIQVMFLPLIQEQDRHAWVNYTEPLVRDYIVESLQVDGHGNTQNLTVDYILENYLEPDIYVSKPQNQNVRNETKPGPYLVSWQRYPLFNDFRPDIRENKFKGPRIRNAFYTSTKTRTTAVDFTSRTDPKTNRSSALSQIMQPIFRFPTPNPASDIDNDIVAAIRVVLGWEPYFEGILPGNAKGIIAVVESTCDTKDNFASKQIEDAVTYQINGLESILLGQGDLHDRQFEHLAVADVLLRVDIPNVDNLPDEICIPQMNLRLYPSKELEDQFITKDAIYYTVGVVAIFAFTTLVFLTYDWTVRERQSKFMQQIIRQDKIVLNMFPHQIRDKLYAAAHRNAAAGNGGEGSFSGLDGMSIDGIVETHDVFSYAGPLADLYLDVTVMFADIAGFTAWSSAREPPQVFTLLETIYGAFDVMANRLGIFKVETVGDCYVCCAGLPDPREDHAVAIAKFAVRCLIKMKELTSRLEVSLGPETTDLSLRIGIHTGQVTGGVIRGERSRFQLFGDTVNTTARMESTSKANHIQISATTADCLIQAGKKNWIQPREESVTMKGKGNMNTFWLKTNPSRKSSKVQPHNNNKHDDPEAPASMNPIVESSDVAYDEEDQLALHTPGKGINKELHMTKTERLVEWNVNILSELLRQIIAARNRKDIRSFQNIQSVQQLEEEILDRRSNPSMGGTVLDEFQEIISLPQVKTQNFKNRRAVTTVGLHPKVLMQLRELITTWSNMYRDNEFHNFEHASHVTASVRKLLTRIVKVDTTTTASEEMELVDLAGHSYGITSDPLTQFAVVLSAVIHDLDHPGIPNSQCVKENIHKASIYKKSIAEQNSVDLAWEVLMQSKFSDLRACIYTNVEELKRFRQLVVNAVMATDIVDKELQALRKGRWETAFSSETHSMDRNPQVAMNRKATIVIEHLIQASDVAHMMQHFKVYRLWNEKFFRECYSAYNAGRADQDPSLGWYKGEIGFFDFYVIPLTKKLENCGVFGVSSHEYLAYAQSNRDEWEREGEKIVAEYVANYNQLHPQPEQATNSNDDDDDESC